MLWNKKFGKIGQSKTGKKVETKREAEEPVKEENRKRQKNLLSLVKPKYRLKKLIVPKPKPKLKTKIFLRIKRRRISLSDSRKESLSDNKEEFTKYGSDFDEGDD